MADAMHWDDEDELLTPEEALSQYPEAEVTEEVARWVGWAAGELTTGWNRRCLLEELADTHCPEAAAALMADPVLLDRAWANVDKKAADRCKLAGYLARKALRAGRDLADLTAKQQDAVRYITEQAAQKVDQGRALAKAERELLDLVGPNAGSTWL